MANTPETSGAAETPASAPPANPGRPGRPGGGGGGRGGRSGGPGGGGGGRGGPRGAKTDGPGGPGGGPGRGRNDRARGGDDRRGRGSEGSRDEVELTEKLVSINRVAKVVKGGRRFGFAALVVVGDGRGRVGHGAGKAREVPEAIRKATEQAKRGMIKVPLREGRTLHHDIIGHYGAGQVVLRAAAPGTGIIAGGPTRAVFEALGVHDVVAKSVGTSNPHNMIKATFAALKGATSPRAIAQKRGKKVSDLVGAKREAEAS
jgi:small subunit ribosomal protein S5